VPKQGFTGGIVEYDMYVLVQYSDVIHKPKK